MKSKDETILERFVNDQCLIKQLDQRDEKDKKPLEYAVEYGHME